MSAFSIDVKAESTAHPMQRMAILAGVAEAVARHSGQDPADAVMSLVWAAAHIARVRGGCRIEKIAQMLEACIEDAAACEAGLAAQEAIQ